MIQVKDILKKNIQYKVTYCEETKILYIEENSDNSITPHRSATDCLFWLNEDNTMSEVECVFPQKRESSIFPSRSNIQFLSGTPVLDIKRDQRSTEIYWDDTVLAIIFESKKQPNKIIESANLAYHINDEEVIAIVCKDFKII